MNRRQYLALAGGAALAGIAGCSGGSQEDDGTPTAGDTPDGDGDSTEPLVAAQAELSTATESLQAAEAPATYAEIDATYSYDAAAVTTALENAEAALDRAADDADGETVDILRSYATFLRDRAAAHDAIVTIGGHITAGTTAYTDGRFDEMDATLQSAKQAVPDAREQWNGLSTAIEALDDRSRGRHDLSVDAHRQAIETARTVLDVVHEHVRGGQEIAAGRQERADARSHYNADEYSLARDGYLAARAELDSARTRYEDTAATVEIALQAELVTWACWVDTYIASINQMLDACDHALADRYGKAGDARKRAQETIRDATCEPVA